jgi:hypothetical protein
MLNPIKDKTKQQSRQSKLFTTAYIKINQRGGITMNERQFADAVSNSLKALLVEIVQNRIRTDALIKLLEDKGLVDSDEAQDYINEFINTKYQPLLNEIIGTIDLILKDKA